MVYPRRDRVDVAYPDTSASHIIDRWDLEKVFSLIKFGYA